MKAPETCAKKYVGNEIIWQMDGRLRFANMFFYDTEVLLSRWNNGNLIMEMSPEDWFGSRGELAWQLSVTFVDAKVLRQDGWFDGEIIWWYDQEIEQEEDGYVVRIKGNRPPEGADTERMARISISARDILVHMDGEVLPPQPGRLPSGELVRALSQYAPEERRRSAREHILQQQDFEYSNLVCPCGMADCWENCAEILCVLRDEQVQRVLSHIHMFRWVTNPDWPGAGMLRERLERVSPEIMKQALETAIGYAAELRNAEWLNVILDYVKSRQFHDLLDADAYAVLHRYDQSNDRTEKEHI